MAMTEDGGGASRSLDPSPGGGSGWENPHDAASLKPYYNEQTGQWEWRYPDGSTPGNSYIRDAVRGTERDIYNTPGPGGGGGGLPAAVSRLAPLAAGALAGRSAFGGSPSGAAPIPPELTELLRMSLQRVRDQEPLFQSITAQARGGLPTAYQK